MNTTSSPPVRLPTGPAVLLCFLPLATTQESVQARVSIAELAQRLQLRLPTSVRVLKIDESLHPEVVKSFRLSQLPALVLVQQGIERWRKEGIWQFDELVLLPAMFEMMNEA